MNYKKTLYIILTLMLIAVTACSNANTQPPPAGGAAQSNGHDYIPLPKKNCQAIQKNARAALQVKFTLADKPLTDFGLQGTACTIEAKGTGEKFDLQNSLKLLEAKLTGWVPDSQLAAGGPTGIVQGYRQGPAIILISIQWQPSSDANCPSDQPIENCPLTPQQKLFTITLQVAQK